MQYFKATYLNVTNVKIKISKILRSTTILATSSLLLLLCPRNTCNFTSIKCPIAAFKSHCNVEGQELRPSLIQKQSPEGVPRKCCGKPVTLQKNCLHKRCISVIFAKSFGKAILNYEN